MPFPLLAALPFAAKATAAGLAAYGVGKGISAGVKKGKRGKAAKVVKNIRSKGGTPTAAQIAATQKQPRKSPGLLHGTEGRAEQLNLLSPTQQATQDAVLQRVLQSLGHLQLPGGQGGPNGPGGPSFPGDQGFTPFEAQARQGFHQNTIPTIAERFTSLGGGTLDSPALISQLGQAARGFESDLSAQRQQYGLNQQQMQNSNLLNLLNTGLNRSQENLYHPGAPSALQSLGNAAAYGFGKAAPTWFFGGKE